MPVFWVWQSWQSGQPLKGLIQRAQPALQAMGSPGPEKCTKAFTRDLLTRGGWSSPQMVVRYMHTSEERDAQVASQMGRSAESPHPLASNAKSTDTSLDENPVLSRAGGDRTLDPGIMSPLL